MKAKYVLKRVDLSPENDEKDGLELPVGEGDIILDKFSQIKVLPAARDLTKPITRKKVSSAGDFDTAFYNPTLYHQCFYWWYYCIQKKPSSHFYEDGEIITVFSSF